MVAQKNILVVDGDIASRIMLTGLLVQDGDMAVWQASTAGDAAAMVLAREPRIDAVLMEASLPDEEGWALCARLRGHGLRIPILMVSVLGEEADVIRGLNAGANDYVVKPFRGAELKARLLAQLRSFEGSEDAVLPVGPYQFRPAMRQLQDTRANRRIRLTDKETAVLKYLYRAGGSPVARRTLLREVWGYCPTATTHTVETHIYRLRRKIEPDANRIRLLVNEDGGYRLDPAWVPEPMLRRPQTPELRQAAIG